ncbi:uncharacterized protein LOC124441240 [Xenia sp. Carnegie-2017]|uniref:uncharacterized protein LOC124441240 n=1 Tax=Xenia sp. Carnegie-2017 TaxID=2897299 RepID=UPI001F04B2A3|nr:uncharacterized protein LOC124441240 [Xenia sp. Carnegie-2017]
MNSLPRLSNNKCRATRPISLGPKDNLVYAEKSAFVEGKKTATSLDGTQFELHGNNFKDEQKTYEYHRPKFFVSAKNDPRHQNKVSQIVEAVSNDSKNDKESQVFGQCILPHTDISDCFHVKMSNEVSFVSLQLSKVLREKDREIVRLRESIRKALLDRENATGASTRTRMRVAELKTKLSNQKRRMEHATKVERLRCKEKVTNETERLRHERDEAREQLEQRDKMVWHLRKQVEQLGYLSNQRYKTIQELNKKMAVKEKNIQEMRRRMEQAQLITIPGTSSAERERRNSTSSADGKSIKWDESGRLATVIE